MRWRRADLRGRVNGNLELRFGRTGLTSYAGLEFVRRYFDTLGLVRLVRRELAGGLPRADFRGAPGGVGGFGLVVGGGPAAWAPPLCGGGPAGAWPGGAPALPAP